MKGSLEIFDTKTMEHIGTHSFGVYVGFFTWIDRRDGDWYLMFVHYENEALDLGRGAAYTTLARWLHFLGEKGAGHYPLNWHSSQGPYGKIDAGRKLKTRCHHEMS